MAAPFPHTRRRAGPDSLPRQRTRVALRRIRVGPCVGRARSSRGFRPGFPWRQAGALRAPSRRGRRRAACGGGSFESQERSSARRRGGVGKPGPGGRALAYSRGRQPRSPGQQRITVGGRHTRGRVPIAISSGLQGTLKWTRRYSRRLAADPLDSPPVAPKDPSRTRRTRHGNRRDPKSPLARSFIHLLTALHPSAHSGRSPLSPGTSGYLSRISRSQRLAARISFSASHPSRTDSGPPVTTFPIGTGGGA